MTESEHRLAPFDCHFSFMGAKGLPRVHREYHLHNQATTQTFNVQELTRTSFIGCMEHIVRISCA